MRILITNDDGINSPVLLPLAEWAKKHGTVTIVAPKYEQSGKSQAIDFARSVEVKESDMFADIEAYAMDSTPADCVRFAVLGLNRTYDLVISGINRGYNLGHDIAYSGTVGAIMEASRLGIKAMALSTDFQSFDNAVLELDTVYGYIANNRLFETAELLNVNIPMQKSRGICLTRQGGAYFSDAFRLRDDGLYEQYGAPVQSTDEDLTVDISAILNGYISVSPLTSVKTDIKAFDVLKSLNKK